MFNKIQINNKDYNMSSPTSDEYKKWLFNTKKGILKFNHYDLANSETYEEERNALEKFDNFLCYQILKQHNVCSPFPLDIER